MFKFKKSIILLALVSVGFSATNCYGPFKLTKKLHAWNGTVTGDKYINAILFYVLNVVPAYPIAVFGDAVIFNTLEFWTGDNPIAMNEGEKETKLVTDAGKTYQVTASKNQFEVVQVLGPNQGESATLSFNTDNNIWSVSSCAKTIELLKVVDNGIEVINPDGSTTFKAIY